jgi:hypothetical protein
MRIEKVAGKLQQLYQHVYQQDWLYRISEEVVTRKTWIVALPFIIKSAD